MPIAGKEPGRYMWAGNEVEVRPDGFVSLAGTPYLAGSVLNLQAAVENTARLPGVSIFDAMKMAGENPARLLGERLQGCSVDLECTDHTLDILSTTVNGQLVWEKD